MSLNLSKGESLNLTKAAPSLAVVVIGAGWDRPKDANGKEISVDLDLSAFALNAQDNCRSEDDFIYFGAAKDANGNPVLAGTPGSIVHNISSTIVSTGDNRTGEGDGDDEAITVNLAQLDADIVKVVFALTRYDNGPVALGDVPNAVVRAVNNADNAELSRFEVVGEATAKSLVFAELVRGTSGWDFKAVGEYSQNDLGGLSKKYGL